ncbi:membrane protein, partial [Mycobacterium rhizamassiliense]
VTGPDSFAPAPLYIPQDVDMTAVKAQVAASGVSASPDAKPALLDIVNQAHAEGIDLKIVLLDHNPPNDTPLRDISTVVGADYPDATVLTLSPSYVGTYSTHYPRVTLEAGEDIAKTGNPVVSAQHFLHELNSPEFPWTGLTIVLLIGVLAAAVGARFLQLRSGRAATSAPGSGAAPAEPEDTV